MKMNVIVINLKKQPEPLSKVLWNILRKFSLLRTPHEERLCLFMASELASVDTTPFSTSILRVLKAALQLDDRLGQINIQVVKGDETGIDLLYKDDDNVLLIHEKWLDFDKTHEDATCELSLLAPGRRIEMEDFSCDHVVEDLFELIIHDIQEQLKWDHSRVTTIRRVARERIRQIPRRIQVSRTCNAGELEVSWVGNESEIIARNYAGDIFCNVKLHKLSSCQRKYEDLLQQGGMYSSTRC
jgi:hypothetical protein